MKYTEELVKIETPDKLNLPGLLFEPNKKGKSVLILLHGNGSSDIFKESAGLNAMATELAKKKISYLAFNNRGAHLLNRFRVEGKKERVMGGMAFELIKDCIKDIDGAVNFLKSRGYRKFYLIGFSTGANKICVYDFYKKQNIISKYVLVGGGDDSGLFYNELGKKKFLRLIAEAKEKNGKGSGGELISFQKIKQVFSYRSFQDITDPDGPYNIFPFHYYWHGLNLGSKKYFKEFSRLKKTSLIVYGGEDEYCYGQVPKVIQTLQRFSNTSNKQEFVVIKNGDHSLTGKEGKLARVVAKWL